MDSNTKVFLHLLLETFDSLTNEIRTDITQGDIDSACKRAKFLSTWLTCKGRNAEKQENSAFSKKNTVFDNEIHPKDNEANTPNNFTE